MEKKVSKSKMSKLNYFELEIQPYLTNQDINNEEAKQIFKWRTHMIEVKENFKHAFDENDLFCPLCSVNGNNDDRDSQEHIHTCSKITEEMMMEEEDIPNIEYGSLFADKYDDQTSLKQTINYLERRLKIRNKLYEFKL